MKVIIFGASGMLGQGVLREALAATDVEEVLIVVRNATGLSHTKLREKIAADLFDLAALEPELRGHDACFYCLGVSSAGMDEDRYRHLTYDLTLAAAHCLARLDPGMTFVYVSGAGTDSGEHGRVMWARVKGATENALTRLGFKSVYLFRPGIIQPLHGAVSKTRSYRLFYRLAGPVLPLLRRLMPNLVLTTETIGQAMLAAVREGRPKAIVDSAGINRLAETGRSG